MTTPVTQRWREHRDSYRPAGEPIRTSEYEVAAIPDDTTAKQFILDHHYSGTFPAARFRFGLYHHTELVGVAVYSVPANNAVLTKEFPTLQASQATELGRLVLLDEVPSNGETWFVARTFELLRDHVQGIVSFSDPIPRTTVDGQVIFPGHIGTIYQAHNGRYVGRGKARVLRLLPDATVFSERAQSKIRNQERGWRYSAALLEKWGAAPLTGDPAEWVKLWVAQLTRPLRHPGNYKYIWALEKKLRKSLKVSLPYPKRDAVCPVYDCA